MGTWSKTAPGDILLWSAEVDGAQVSMYKQNRYGFYYNSRISCAPKKNGGLCVRVKLYVGPLPGWNPANMASLMPWSIDDDGQRVSYGPSEGYIYGSEKYLADTYYYTLPDSYPSGTIRAGMTHSSGAERSPVTLDVPSVDTAESGSFTAGGVTFSWNRRSYNTTNNTTDIAWTTSGSAASGVTVKIDHNTVWTGGAAASGTATIQHNDTGKLGAFCAEISTSSGSGGGQWRLPDVPQLSSLTVSGGTLGTAMTITIAKVMPSFTHTIRCDCGTYSAVIAERTAQSAVSWTPPYTIAAQSTASDSVNVTLTLSTYDGDTLNGSVAKGIDLTIPDNAETKPTAGLNVAPSHELSTAFDGVFVQGKSKALVTFRDAAGKYGASIASYRVTADGSEYTGQSVKTEALSESGERTVTGYVTDSRGFSSSPITASVTVVPYRAPAVVPHTGRTGIVCIRTDAAGNASESGSYLRIMAGRQYSTVTANGTQRNFCALRYRHKQADSETYSGWVTLIARNDLASNDVDVVLENVVPDPKYSYDIQLGVIDDAGEEAVLSLSVPSQDVPLHLGFGGKNVGIGRAANYTSEHRIDIGWETHFENGVYIGDEALANFVMEQGTDGIWSYRRWENGTAECFGQWTGTLANASTANGFSVYQKELTFRTGLFIEAPVVSCAFSVGTVVSASGVGAVSETAMTVTAFAVSGGEQTVRIYAHAIGRWK